jgi:hypothetical protein
MLLALANTTPTTAAPTTSPASVSPFLTLPDRWPEQLDLLQFCQQLNPGTAALLLVAGVIYLLWGYYLFKALITLNAGLAGAYIGALLGQYAGAAVPGACVGCFVAAAVTWPMMRWAVAITGALFGFILGVSMWRAFGLDVAYGPAGGAIGLVFFGMLTFVLFKGSVMMFTSMQGAAMIILGMLGLVQKYQAIAPSIQSGILNSPVVLPLAVFIPAVVGLIYQQSMSEADAAAGKKK